MFLLFAASKMSCYMNPNADPCDQFYEYACGRWELHHPIPKDRVGYDIFEILREVIIITLLTQNTILLLLVKKAFAKIALSII